MNENKGEQDANKTAGSEALVEVSARVEGVDDYGRPRLLRCFYPEDGDAVDDSRMPSGTRVIIRCDARDVAKTIKR